MTNQDGEAGISRRAGGELGAAELLKPVACAGHAVLLGSPHPALGCLQAAVRASGPALAWSDVAPAIARGFPCLPGERVALEEESSWDGPNTARYECI